jgi:hypothetical protein
VQGLSEEGEKEFWEDVTEEDLKTLTPGRYSLRAVWRGRCAFLATRTVWDVADRFYTVNLKHPITGDPITMDDFQVMGSGDVKALLSLCDKAETEQAATGGIIDPPPEFFEPYSTYAASALSDIKEKIRRKARSAPGRPLC